MAPHLTTPEDISTFQRDGVVLVPRKIHAIFLVGCCAKKLGRGREGCLIAGTPKPF